MTADDLIDAVMDAAINVAERRDSVGQPLRDDLVALDAAVSRYRACPYCGRTDRFYHPPSGGGSGPGAIAPHRCRICGGTCPGGGLPTRRKRKACECHQTEQTRGSGR